MSKEREIKDPKPSGESKIRTAAEEKKHKLEKTVMHCIPIEVYRDKDTGLVDETVFCNGCHTWVQVDKCEIKK